MAMGDAILGKSRGGHDAPVAREIVGRIRQGDGEFTHSSSRGHAGPTPATPPLEQSPSGPESPRRSAEAGPAQPARQPD